MASDTSSLLYRPHELAFRTQYAELKERSAAAGVLLPGTPGTLVLRSGTGHSYWYRSHYAVPGRAAEDYIGRVDDEGALKHAQERIAFADWAARQVRDLRKLQFQVADKDVARVLVELHNAGLVAAGLVLVGTLAWMAWLNELGAKAVSARTQDIDLARRQALSLAAPQPLLAVLAPTRLELSPVPGLARGHASTSLKRPGAAGLRIDFLADGSPLGHAVALPELHWHAQAVPHLDHLLDDARPAALLAGGHCVPVLLPAPERLVWHKVYASAARRSFPEKARKDLIQAATLAAALVEQDDTPLTDGLRDMPGGEWWDRIVSRGDAVFDLLSAHPEAQAQWQAALNGRPKASRQGTRL